MKYTVKYCCLSHTGNCRSMNQDNYICLNQYRNVDSTDMEAPITGVVTNETPSMFGIFDGMGGEEHGEIASFIAAKNAGTIKFNKNIAKTLEHYCVRTNEDICRYTADNMISSMGTTAALLVFAKKMITLCNIGDSKIFRMCGNKIQQISYDHVVISAYGTKPPLSQNLGIPPDELIIDPYVSQGKYHDGDIYLICSDGLTDMVDTEDIERILKGMPLEKATTSLLSNALANGGRDNITIILLQVNRKKLFSKI